MTTNLFKTCSRCNKSEPDVKFDSNYRKVCNKCRHDKQQWAKKNPEKNNAQTKKWIQENPDKAKLIQRRANLKRTYGISLEQYQELLEKQNYQCYICGKTEEENKRALAVDHAHGESEWVPEGAIRGLLCGFCNQRLIGRHKDANLFAKASEYLKQHTGWIVPKKKRQKKKKRKAKAS